MALMRVITLNSSTIHPMAYLQSLNWTLEIRYYPKPGDPEWLHYEIYFRYKGEPIIRDDLLKRSPKAWGDRPPGALLANEHGGCSLVPTLKRVLETNQAQYWQPIEPDFTIAFYPGMYFPFQPSHWVDVTPPEMADPEDRRYDVGPDDTPVTIIAMVDAYNFGQEFAYNLQGPALILHVERRVLEQFCDDLQADLESYLSHYGPILTPGEVREDL